MKTARHPSYRAGTWPAFSRFQLQHARGSFKTAPPEGLGNKHVQKHPGLRPGYDSTLPIPCFSGGSVPDSWPTGRLGFFPQASQPTFLPGRQGRLSTCPLPDPLSVKNRSRSHSWYYQDGYVTRLKRRTWRGRCSTSTNSRTRSRSSTSSSWRAATGQTSKTRPTHRPTVGAGRSLHAVALASRGAEGERRGALSWVPRREPDGTEGSGGHTGQPGRCAR